MAHIVIIGEVLAEILRPGVGQRLDQTGPFMGPYASGAPAISAVAAARLGQQVGFIGGIGEDAFGQLIKKRLEAEGVETTGLQTIAGRTTGIAFVGYDPDGSREFVFHLRDSAAGSIAIEDIPDTLFDGIRWLHLSGSTIVLNQASLEACRYAVTQTGERGGRVSFDPNLRPELMAAEKAAVIFEPFLKSCDLILPTAEEALALTGQQTVDQAAAVLLDRYQVPVAVKQGSNGCTIYTGSGSYRGPGYAVEEIDPTGAGDSFNAACIFGLEQGWTYEYIARFASAAGALSVTRMGPMEGTSTVEEIKKLMDTQNL